MGDTESDIQGAGSTAMLRPLRRLIASEPEAPLGWRDDLRLFALTWAAGFVFFLVMLA